MNRPTTDGSHGSVTTTPMAATMVALLGGYQRNGVTLSNDEFKAVQRLYGFTPEKPNVKPPPPAEPNRDDFPTVWEYNEAKRKHEAALAAHAKWQDPQPFMQAGADRNAFRLAEVDGLRLLAWFARYLQPGDDPLRVLVQMAIDAGWDVDPSDVTWAQGNNEAEESDE